MAQKSFFKFLPLVLICTLAFAEEDSKAKQNFSIYMHPASLYGLVLLVESNAFFYFTAEYKLTDFYSIVLAPSIWSGKWTDSRRYYNNRARYFRLGSEIGIRRFMNSNAEGFYLQLLPGVYHFSCEESYTGETISKTMIDALGYVGYARKLFGFNAFAEAGIGYRWSSLRYSFEDIPFPLSSGYKNLALNINMGVGLPLF
jgi:hypothetical protein